MRNQTIPSLHGELSALFDLGKQISDAKPFPDSIFLVHGKCTYLFKDWGYRGWMSGAGSVFPEESGVSFRLVASTLGRHDDQPETPWRAASEAREFETVPELYELQSLLSTNEVLRIAKENHYLGVSFAVTTGESNAQIANIQHFPAWWQDPNENFFKQRGLNSGSFVCNRIVQYVLDLAARPQEYENFELPDFYAYSENSLNYEAQLNGFVMNMKMTQKPGESTAELIMALRRIHYFLFEGMDGFVERKGSTSFAEHFAEFLALEKFPPLRPLLEGNYIDPFVDEDDRSGSKSKWWFTPVAVRIEIEKLEIDPSFGTFTPSSSKKFDILELRENWLKTNFAAINESAYLERLLNQAHQLPPE